VIIDEKPNIERIVATLGLKEMTQGTLIRKLCTYTTPNPTRRAIFEFDKLIRSIYTLRYLRDPQLERTVHRSQNRIESYHQLRSAIAQVGGKKELSGQTDIEFEISNQCAVDRQCDHLLQLGDPVAAAQQVRGERQYQSACVDHADLAGSVAPHPAERALHLSQRWDVDRPGCYCGWA
jgi:hypothetical protein